LWIAILSFPMWSGHLLAGPYSDQYATGYAFRWWGAHQMRATGLVPQWNPLAFGGLQTFGVFGDLFYPTSLLRLVLPTALAMDLGFAVHYVIAGFALYLLLRLLGLSWAAALTGGTAYQLSGVVVSLVSPGHDGKLFVTALLPVMLIGLVLGVRRRRWEGFSLFSLALGLALLSPQFQATQYALIASGLFTLYLAFGEPAQLSSRERWIALGGAVGAVCLGFGVSMIQVWPFFHYIPYSPRAEDAGYAWSASYAMPWSHVPELFFSGFAGHYETYWGPNAIKLHSEYLGLPVLALAALGATSPRRRLVWWVGGIGLLFLLVALGDGTPFYHLWYALVPYVKKTRAPGIALYVVALAVSTLAALGVERLERGEGKRPMQIALAASGFAALLAAAGVFGSLAQGIARGIPPTLHPTVEAAGAAQPAILAGALGSAIGLGLVAGLALAFLGRRVPPAVFATMVVLLVGADLYRAGREFWQWSQPERGLFASDAILERLQLTPPPFRIVNNLPGTAGVYPRMTLMRFQIPEVLGESSIELRFYDDLLGGRNQWANFSRLHLWDLLAVRYAVLPDTFQLPGFRRVLGPVTTGAGRAGYLYEAESAPPYARVVPGAVKVAAAQLVQALINPRMDYDRLVLFDSTVSLTPAPLTEMPPPSPSRATFTHYAPGRMDITLEPPPPADSYLVIAENWYPAWHAQVDGAPVDALRGDETFLTVPLKAGAKKVELTFNSPYYHQGRLVTWGTLLLLVAWAGAAVGVRRIRARG
jgi:hypothetical protein